MRIAITGASGHVGNNLSRALLAQGHELRLMVHRQDEGLQGLEAEVVRCNLLDREGVRSFVKGVDAVIHTAAVISVAGGDPQGRLADVNIAGTRHVVDACLQEGVGRLLHFGTIHVFDPFPLEEVLDETRALRTEGAGAYDRTKVAGNRLVLDAVEKGLDAVILSPTSVFGPHDYYPSLLGKGISDIYRKRIPMLIPGGYDFVFVDDVVNGAVNALERGRTGENYLLSGHYLTVKQLAALIGEVGGVRTPRRIVPMPVLQAMLPVFRIQSKLTGQPALFTRESLKVLKESPQRISSAKAEKELGYRKTEIGQAMKATLDWFADAGLLHG